MNYYLSQKVSGSFSEVVARVRKALQSEGFGVLTEIDVQKTLQEKLQVSYKPYLILGACNPPLAWRALQAEEHIGTMLPCNVIVKEEGDGVVEVAAVDPVASMMAVATPQLHEVAGEVRKKLQKVVQAI